MAARPLKIAAVGFLGGVVGTLLFHQVVLLALNALGWVPFAPYSMKPVPPFGVPQFVSLAFWGGVWGIVLATVMERWRVLDRFWFATLFGGIMPTLVGVLVVLPLKGGNPADWLHLPRMAIGFTVNGAWGLGVFVVYRLARAGRPVSRR